MRNSILALIIALSLALAFGGSGYLTASEGGTVSDTAEAVAQITLASQLAIEGRTTQSPLVLAAAAEILGSIAVKAEKWDKTQEGGDEAAAPPAAPASALKFDAKILFDEAIALAKNQNNEALAGIISSAAAAVGARQSSGRPIEHTATVRPSPKDVYRHSFRGGELARVGVIADGDYDIELQIYDLNDNLIVQDIDPTSVGLCEWTPSRTGEYKIKVVNTTGYWVDYLLLSN